MNHNDEFQAWLNGRQEGSPPTDLTDRIMVAVRESASELGTPTRSEPVRATVLRRALPYLVCSAAALMLAMRLYSFVSVFVAAPSEAEIAMTEPVEEFPDVNNP